MRSIMEIVLRDHYGARDDGANAVLHDTETDEAMPKLETAQLEREIVWLLRVLRALIENAPSKASIAATAPSNRGGPR
jgi:hypothetical protein